MANIIQLKIEGVGREGKGDPLGKTSEGKIVFIRGNKNLKKGDFVKCEIKKPSYKYCIADFVEFVKEVPKAEGPISGLISGGKANELTKEPVKIQPVKTPQRKELEEKIKILKKNYPVNRFLSYEAKMLIKGNLHARRILKHILNFRDNPAIAIPSDPTNLLIYSTFFELISKNVISTIKQQQWCFRGEDYLKLDGSIEFVRREDIRIAMDDFLRLISK
jgi:predicted RNA-binding protein with TRAM domain